MKKKIYIILGIIIVAIIVAGFIINYVSSSKEKLEYNSQYSIDLDTNNIISNRTEDKTSKEEHFFYGKIIESTDSYIIVEPNEGEEVRKSADKISIGLGEYNDALYVVGTNVKITYNGTIMETYPAQVEASKIEIKSTENFEILFYDKQPQSDVKASKIINKKETDKYDYDIYVYEGNVNIRIDGEDYSLKDALLENKITIEEIIAKANQDAKDGKIKAEMYKDGGSMEYHYENYTIIKCHTIDGNRDVYIGSKSLNLNDVI